MNNSAIWTNIITFVGGGLVVYFIDLFVKSGKVKIDDYSLQMTYLHTSDLKSNIVTLFKFDIQFMNTSSHSRIVNNFSARFFDGERYHELIFYGYNVPPAEVIPPKEVICLQFGIVHPRGNFRIPNDLNKYQLTVNFNLNNRPNKLDITGDKLQLNDATGTAMVR